MIKKKKVPGLGGSGGTLSLGLCQLLVALVDCQDSFIVPQQGQSESGQPWQEVRDI